MCVKWLSLYKYWKLLLPKWNNNALSASGLENFQVKSKVNFSQQLHEREIQTKTYYSSTNICDIDEWINEDIKHFSHAILLSFTVTILSHEFQMVLVNLWWRGFGAGVWWSGRLEQVYEWSVICNWLFECSHHLLLSDGTAHTQSQSNYVVFYYMHTAHTHSQSY